MFGFGEAIKKTKPPQDSLQAEYCSYYSPMDITSTCVEIQESGRPAVLNYCLKSDDWTITFQERGLANGQLRKKTHTTLLWRVSSQSADVRIRQQPHTTDCD